MRRIYGGGVPSVNWVKILNKIGHALGVAARLGKMGWATAGGEKHQSVAVLRNTILLKVDDIVFNVVIENPQELDKFAK